MLLTKSEEGDYLSYGFPMGKPKYLKEAVDALYEYSKEKKRKFQMHNVTPEQFALLEEIYREDFRSNTAETMQIMSMKQKSLQNYPERNIMERRIIRTSSKSSIRTGSMRD